MGNFSLGNGEHIIFEDFNTIWVTRNDQQLSHFVITNQKMYCFYKKKNGLFKKSTKEVETFNLSDILIFSGEAQIFQLKDEGKHVIQMKFDHGVEKLYFPDVSKKKISQYISKLHDILDPVEGAKAPKKKDGILNTLIKLEGKRLGQKTATEYISTLKEKHHLIVKHQIIPKNILPSIFDVFDDGLYRFLIYNEEGTCVFRSDGGRLLDQNMIEVGRVTEKLISLRVPLLEKNKKEYTVRFKGEELCQITACISMGMRDISCSGPFSISRSSNHFTIERKFKKFAQVYIVPSTIQRGHVDKFVIGYNNPEDSALATLLCIAYNLAEENLSDSK